MFDAFVPRLNRQIEIVVDALGFGAGKLIPVALRIPQPPRTPGYDREIIRFGVFDGVFGLFVFSGADEFADFQRRVSQQAEAENSVCSAA